MTRGADFSGMGDVGAAADFFEEVISETGASGLQT
jgi:hypothetical protein